MVGRVAFYLHILFLVTIRAALVNVTIDDTDGDSVTHQLPVYQPASPWGGPSCVGCDIVPNPSLAFDGTWHAATYHPQLLNVNITFSFTGKKFSFITLGSLSHERRNHFISQAFPSGYSSSSPMQTSLEPELHQIRSAISLSMGNSWDTSTTNLMKAPIPCSTMLWRSALTA